MATRHYLATREKIYVVAMSVDEAYVLLKQGDSYALEYNGVDPQQANWVEGNGLVVPVDAKECIRILSMV